MFDLGRVLTAMVTPFDSGLRVDYAKAAELAKRLVDTGSDGVVVAGSTGESPTLSKEEKGKLFETVVDAVGDRAVVVAGTGTNSTADSIALTKVAEKAGAKAVMLVAPYYNKPSQEGLYAHFKEVASHTALPVMLYNVPGRTGCSLDSCRQRTDSLRGWKLVRSVPKRRQPSSQEDVGRVRFHTSSGAGTNAVDRKQAFARRSQSDAKRGWLPGESGELFHSETIDAVRPRRRTHSCTGPSRRRSRTSENTWGSPAPRRNFTPIYPSQWRGALHRAATRSPELRPA